jgi:hypothetical protein
MRPLRTWITSSCAEKTERTFVDEKHESAPSYPSDRTLVAKEPLPVLAGVNVSCPRNQASQNEGTFRIAIERFHRLCRRISCDAGGVLSCQRRSPDRNQQQACEPFHNYLPFRSTCTCEVRMRCGPHKLNTSTNVDGGRPGSRHVLRTNAYCGRGAKRVT